MFFRRTKTTFCCQPPKSHLHRPVAQKFPKRATLGAAMLRIEQLEERALLAVSPLGTTFEGQDFLENATNHTPVEYDIPPDPTGAAGPDHVVSAVNTTIAWYTREGVQQETQRLGPDEANGVVGQLF